MADILKAEGITGQIEVSEGVISITRKGLRATLSQGKKGELTIPVNHVTKVDYKKASFLTNGHIHFLLEEEKEGSHGILNCPMTVIFNRKQEAEFGNIAEMVTKLKDELAKDSKFEGPKNSQVSSSIKLKASIEMGTDDTVQRLLKEASQKKRDGDIDGAIEVLKAAYEELDEHSWSFPIEVYLRLPLYLQESGKKDEAWKEFNRLVLWVNSKPRYSHEGTPMELSAIWDKMRLFLQREGQNDYAVQFAVWSYLSWAVGLYMQKREDELAAYKAETNIQKALNTSLHKAGKEFLTDRLVKIILNSLENVPAVNYKEIAKTVQEELNNK